MCFALKIGLMCVALNRGEFSIDFYRWPILVCYCGATNPTDMHVIDFETTKFNQ